MSDTHKRPDEMGYDEWEGWLTKQVATEKQPATGAKVTMQFVFFLYILPFLTVLIFFKWMNS